MFADVIAIVICFVVDVSAMVDFLWLMFLSFNICVAIVVWQMELPTMVGVTGWQMLQLFQKEEQHLFQVLKR